MERSGRFRVYRGVESVPHINVQAVDEPTLYSVYRSGYTDNQSTVDALETGDLIEATLAGDPADDAEPWRLTAVKRVGRVRTAFAVDIDPPEVARNCWTPGAGAPSYTVLTENGDPIGVCGVQPRAPLPNDGAFVPSVLTGLLPLEAEFESVPEIGDPAVEALFLDPDPPDASPHAWPYGVVFLFTRPSTTVAEGIRDAYDCPLTGDTRPSFDPYGL